MTMAMANILTMVYDEDWEGLKAAISSNNRAARELDRARRSLLHYVLWKQAPADVCEMTLQAYPAAAALVDVDGRQPLHFASQCVSAVTVAMVLDEAPSAATKTDKNGRTALHYACWRGADEAVIRTLLDATALHASDKDGKIPAQYESRQEILGEMRRWAEDASELTTSVRTKDSDSSDAEGGERPSSDGDEDDGEDSDDPFADMEALLDGNGSDSSAADDEPEIDVDDDFAALAAMLG